MVTKKAYEAQIAKIEIDRKAIKYKLVLTQMELRKFELQLNELELEEEKAGFLYNEENEEAPEIKSKPLAPMKDLEFKTEW